MILRTLSIVWCISLLPTSLSADDWARWRGPHRDGVSNETGWRTDWPKAGPPVAWRADVGVGFSSVAVVDGRLVTMGNRENRDTVSCLETSSGRKLWSHSYDAALDDRFFEGGPTSTPTIEGNRVYTLSRQGDLFCFDVATGAIRWSTNVAEKAGVRIPGWGFSGSPVVLDKRILLNVGEAGTAVDRASGRILWTSANRDAGYNTPVPMMHDGKWIVLLASGRFYHAVDVATGKELWRHRWLTTFGCNAADPVIRGDRVFLSSGYHRGAVMLDLTKTEPTVVWQNKSMRNQFASSVLVDGFLYGIDGNSDSETSLRCLEFATGRIAWDFPWQGAGSLTVVDGYLLILGEKGDLVLGKVSHESFQPMARVNVLSGKCWTVPVLSEGRIYCRNAGGEIVCLDVRQTP